jgi:hypothetical protein
MSVTELTTSRVAGKGPRHLAQFEEQVGGKGHDRRSPVPHEVTLVT